MSALTAVQPPEHTLPIGKYSPGILAPVAPGKSLLFISGQVASDAEGRVIGVGDPARQAEAVFANIEAVLRSCNGSLADLVSVVIYVTDVANFAAISEVRNRVLRDPPPASTLVEVSRLAIAEHLVEISATALISSNV
jgi:enamine deaminase RidA (YjgF/YER057c/UK114 family)